MYILVWKSNEDRGARALPFEGIGHAVDHMLNLTIDQQPDMVLEEKNRQLQSYSWLEFLQGAQVL